MRKKVDKKEMIKFSILFAVIFLFLSLTFQNCSQSVLFTDLSDIQVSSKNGTPYDGKQTVTYYRFIESYTCQGRPSALSYLEIQGLKVSLFENSNSQCSNSSTELTAENLDVSQHQNFVVGYEEGIFQLYTGTDKSIPADLIEVWCKETKKGEQPGLSNLEFITYYDSNKMFGSTNIYYSEKSVTKSLELSNTQRLIDINSISISLGETFSLTVHRDRPTAQKGLFESFYKININGQILTSEIACRLGGQVDPTVWPAVQFDNLNVDQVRLSQDKNSLVFLADSTLLGKNLYSLDVVSKQVKRLTSVGPLRRVSSFIEENEKYFFNADFGAQFAAELFSLDKSTLSLNRVSQELNSPYAENQFVTNDFKFIKSLNRIIYKDGSHENSTDVEQWLISARADGSEKKVISRKYTAADSGVQDFQIFESTQRVLYVGGDIMSPELNIVDADGGNHKNVVLPFESIHERINFKAKLIRPAQADYVFVKSVESRPSYVERLYFVSATGNELVRLPTDWSIESVSESGAFVLLSNRNSKLKKIFSSNSRTVEDLGEWLDLKFASFDSDFVGLRQHEGNQRVLQKVNSSTKLIEAACSFGKQEQLVFTQEKSGEIFVAAYKNIESKIELYKLQSDHCQLINSTVLVDKFINSIKEIIISPQNEFALVLASQKVWVSPVRSPTYLQSETVSSVIYLPLNGRASYKLSLASDRMSTIQDIIFTNNKSEFFILLGDLGGGGKKHLYFWRTPQ